MKILVTGASGNVGQYIVEALLEQGEAVVAASTHPDKLKDLFDDHVDCVPFNFTDSKTFDHVLEMWIGSF